MQYMLMICREEAAVAKLSGEERGRMSAAFLAYTNALKSAGVHVEGNRLEGTATATTVRVNADGETSVLDGPYAEAKEQLGGYYIIEVPDLDAAISWAARCPAASFGSVEIRPVGAVLQTA